MGRTALAPYKVDKITYGAHPNTEGMVRARARYRREEGGPLLDIYGKGKTNAAAKRDLEKNLDAKSKQHHGGSSQVTTKTTVAQVAEVWLGEKRAQRPPLSDRTLDEYAKWVGAYVEGTDYGRLTITAAANVIRGEQHLRAVANGEHKKSARGGGEGAMRSARKVLHGLMDTAYRHGAIPSPVRFRLQGRTVKDDRRQIDTERAFTPEELRRVQETADASASDVGDLVAFLSVMGCRISEALHGVHWDDVDLQTGRVVIRGTKSKNAVRTATIPAWVSERLAKRAATFGNNGLVFGVTRYASKVGKPRDLSNVLDTLRRVLDDAGATWAGSHTFRRSVATMLDERGHGVGAIATLLGQDPVTTMSYIKTKNVGEAAALAFESEW
ncbi:site-specific integrase [Nocardioides sp. SOB77]|uniref:Site-specific integrase n=1 Tax=Nocardioides oceani TaxID=3058369 RepID=A0ABT8FLM7_9ACTN|nr:site-specific integrase [Nocardioides oceani]MDN4175581.1 site-specific integrase [Nocardioides oceani]